MSKKEAATTSTALVNVVFDPKTKMFLGTGGRWMTATQFVENAPRNPEDLVPKPTPGNPAVQNTDPGPTYRCLNGFLHSCTDSVCVKVIQPNGQPIACRP
jgi:hypothetical protein